MKEKNPILVNFNKPWWYIIAELKKLGVLVLLCEIITSVFTSFTPLILGYLFSLARVDYFTLFCVLWAGERLVEYLRGYLTSLLELQIIYSVHYSAHRYFLEVDPIYHAHRESGAILGKISRGARGYEDFLDVLFSDFLPMIIGISTVLGMLFYKSFWLGAGALLSLMIMACSSIFFIKYLIIPNEKAWLKADDAIKTVSAENLFQVYLIRACFASEQLAEKLKEKGLTVQAREQELWVSYLKLHAFNKILYIVPVFLLGLYLFNEIHKGAIDSVLAFSLLTTYLRGTRNILKLEKPIMKGIKGLTRIHDLFGFIRHFGEQTYPVLHVTEEELPEPQCTTADNIIISADDLYFDYHKDAKIFDGNSLYLKVPCEQKNKLYGIIGPSGVGKSTFISILGGQIKPTHGTVTIDGINIYEVDDEIRKRLIAMQGQVPTSMRGSLRYNLLFGLPESHCYLDMHLIDILVRVGLWSLFEAKKGLETFIGEGGLNLSGGQRQRLNFASLYLRAQYYKPRLILIDEPTSSLDELSERAITHMILELARSAVTMVIAHRIKTIENAVGLLDFSVLSFEKELKFYRQRELLKISPYYRKLVRGKVSLEDGEAR